MKKTALAILMFLTFLQEAKLRVLYQALMPAGWLQIQTANTFEKKSVINYNVYNLRIFTRIFSR